MNNLNSDELRDLVDWMEDARGVPFWKEITSRQEFLISRLIDVNNEEVRGKIKSLGEVAKIHDVAIDMLEKSIDNNIAVN